ncbi:MAG: DUF6776 family protein [Rudaea sp.]
MVKVTPPPALVVRPQRSARGARGTWAIALIWALTLLAAYAGGRIWQQHSASADDAKVSVAEQRDREAQLQRIAVLERADQVAHTATAGLQQALRDRQEEITGLRADLAFYSRLTDGSGKAEGLKVHGLQLTAASVPRVYSFAITLTQTLKSGPVASGNVSLSVSGVSDGKLVTMPWTQLAPNQKPSGMGFSFKYFQQVTGTLMLPQGFTPNRIRVEADAGGSLGHADQEFSWSDALADQEIPDVQHQP